jgi:hypothetical protein
VPGGYLTSPHPAATYLVSALPCLFQQGSQHAGRAGSARPATTPLSIISLLLITATQPSDMEPGGVAPRAGAGG